jgi:hypothetical protein
MMWMARESGGFGEFINSFIFWDSDVRRTPEQGDRNVTQILNDFEFLEDVQESRLV